MTKQIRIDTAMTAPELFGAALGDIGTWSTWLGTLKGAFGERLTKEQLTRFLAITGGRQPPGKRVRELWAVVGRRGGKTRMAALVCAFIATCIDHSAVLSPGELGHVLCLAPTQKQAHAVLNYCRALLEASPTLVKQIETITADEIRLKGGIVISVHAANYRTIRGRTILACVMDESAMWRSEESANPDFEAVRAIVPAMMTTKGMLIGISTPYGQRGILYERYRDYFGKDSDDVLVVKGSTQDFNPTADQAWIERELAEDPDANRAEYLAEFRSDLSAYVDRAVVERCVDIGLMQRPFVQGPKYICFVDPSGGQHDSMCMAISHRDGDRVLLDVAMEWKAPFDPGEIVLDMVRTFKLYRITTIISDRYAGQWVASEFSKHSIHTKYSERDKSTIFLDALPLLTSSNAMLLDSPRMVSQLTQLQREVSKGGRDRVIKMRGSYDDLANAAMGALVEAAARRGMSYHANDGGWQRGEPRVILGYSKSKGKGMAYKIPPKRDRSPATYEQLCVKPEQLRVGGDGWYIEKRGNPAGDGRQQYSVCSPDGMEVSRAWGEEAAVQNAKRMSKEQRDENGSDLQEQARRHSLEA